MTNIIGLIFSFAFVLVILSVSTILRKYKLFNEEGSRKFIHIAVGNWWLIAMYFFDHVIYAALIPALFIVINYLSYRTNFIKAMERQEKKTLGTVFYPISLLILVIVTFGIIKKPEIGAMGVLIMAYGDGLAAVIGEKIGMKKLYNQKTLVGTIVMLLVSITVSSSLLLVLNYEENLFFNVIIISVVATVVELFSKNGWDNITVPLISSLLFYLLIM